QRTAQEGIARRAVTESALDHPAVEELERVERAEPERSLRVGLRLFAATVAGQGPGENVVAVDARTVRSSLLGERERVLEPDSVVDVEQRGLEVGLDPVREQQSLDDADQRVLPAGEPNLSLRAVEVAELRDVLRERVHVD